MTRPYPTLIGLDDWITREPDPDYSEGHLDDENDEYCPDCGLYYCECNGADAGDDNPDEHDESDS